MSAVLFVLLSCLLQVALGGGGSPFLMNFQMERPSRAHDPDPEYKTYLASRTRFLSFAATAIPVMVDDVDADRTYYRGKDGEFKVSVDKWYSRTSQRAAACATRQLIGIVFATWRCTSIPSMKRWSPSTGCELLYRCCADQVFVARCNYRETCLIDDFHCAPYVNFPPWAIAVVVM